MSETRRKLAEIMQAGPGPKALDMFTEATSHEKKEYIKLLKESASRRCEAMKIYEPLPFQQAFHEARNKECIIVKANRAGGAQPLDGRVLTPVGWKRMGDIRVGDAVVAGDGTVTYVTHVHERGWMPVYEVTFTCGARARCTGDHLWRVKITKSEKYKSFKYYKPDQWSVWSLDAIREFGGDAPEPRDRAIIPTAVMEFAEAPVPLHPYVLGVILGDGSISQDSVTFTTEDACIADRVSELCDIGRVSPHAPREDNGNARCYGLVAKHNCTTGKPSPVKQALVSLGLMGLRGEAKHIPDCYLWNTIGVRLELLRGLMDTDGTADKKGNCYFYSSSPQLCNGVVHLVRSLGGRARVTWKETEITIKRKKRGNPGKRTPKHVKRCLNMGVVWLDMPDMCPFHVERKAERWRDRKRLSLHNGMIMKSIKPVSNAVCRCITVAHEDGTYVMDDYVVTHNSLAGFMEDARAACNMDPFKKYPERDGVVVCLGYGENHIGRVIHKFLFRAGSFKIIRDLDTGDWRVFRPWDDEEEWKGKKGDKSRAADAKPAPPLIPGRFIEDIVWEKKGARVFSIVRLTTGWEIYALNSAGDPSQAQGFDVNLYHIDEDTAQTGWYEEAVGRTAMPNGFIRWTALPHARNDDIMGMIDRADTEEEEGIEYTKRTTVLLRASMFDNPFYPKEAREANMKIWAAQGEEVMRKRAYGEIVQDSVLMYPEFNKYIHVARSSKDNSSRIQRFLEEKNGEIPQDWCRDMVVDPGHVVCAVLFIATPQPDQFGEAFHVVYDELYMRQCDAHMFGSRVEAKMGHVLFQRFIIDMHGGSLREIGSGMTPVDRYTQELQKRGIQCAETGSYFMPGSDKINSRVEALREWLHLRKTGNPTVLIDNVRCPNLVRELGSFRKKRAKAGATWVVLDEGDRRANSHAVECLEYAAAHGLSYVYPRVKRVETTYVKRMLKERRMRAAQRRARSTHPEGGTSITLGPLGDSE